MQVDLEPTADRAGSTATLAADPSQGTSHVVEYRVSLPFFGGRYYIAFFSGRCQRSPVRLKIEGQNRSWAHATFSFGMVFLMVSTMLMCAAATVYLAKSMLGIDLLEAHSFMHHWFFN